MQVVVESRTARDGVDREAGHRDAKLTALEELVQGVAVLKKEPVRTPKAAVDGRGGEEEEEEEVIPRPRKIKTTGVFTAAKP